MRYLSDEWLAAADAALRAAADSAPASRLVIDQHVDGAVDYRVRVERHACSIMPLDPADTEGGNAHRGDEPNASFHQSLATAQAVAQGTTDAHQAFLLGHIRFEGDVEILIEARDAFDWLEATLAPILAQTTFG